MIIHKIPIRNRLRNFMYLIADEKTNEALAIDPLAHKLCLQTASEHGYDIRQVVNTHHHHDHVGGNAKVLEATGAKLLAHSKADIPAVDRRLEISDSVKVGSYDLQILDTPGHTLSHVCLYYDGNKVDRQNGEKTLIDQPVLFSGDTIFNAGVGNCYNGGHPEIMYETIVSLFEQLPMNTRLFPGHDYIENNLRFTLDREPSNVDARKLLDEFSKGLDAESYVTTLKQEKLLNVFLRLNCSEIRTKLNQEGFDSSTEKTTFLALRELRNRW